MPENRDERIHVALASGGKAKWEEEAENHVEADGSVSRLVRLAVEKEITGSHARGDGVGEEVGERLSEVLEQNRKITNQLGGLEARLRSIEQAFQKDPEVMKLKSDVFAALPTKEQFQEYDDPSQPLPDRLPEEQGGPLAYSGRVADVATL